MARADDAAVGVDRFVGAERPEIGRVARERHDDRFDAANGDG
jgi:hypothetical protein